MESERLQVHNALAVPRGLIPHILLSVLLPGLQEDGAPVLTWPGGMFLVQVQC